MRSDRKILLASLLVGFVSLSYEIVATKALFFFFSESTYTVATVISIFLLGLALGSFLFAYLDQKIKNKPLFFLVSNYAIALYSLTVLPQFAYIPNLLNKFYADFGNNFYILLAAKFLISALYLIVPTIFLGTLLPFLITRGVSSTDSFGSKIGIIYGVDLLGSICGALLSGFVFIPFLGLKATTFLVAIINFLIGIIFINKRRTAFLSLSFAGLCILGAFLITKPFELTINKETLNKEQHQDQILNTDTGAANTLSKRKLIFNPKIANNNKVVLYDEKTAFTKPSAFGQITVLKKRSLCTPCLSNQKVEDCYDESCDYEFLELYIDSRIQCTTYRMEKNLTSERHFVDYALKLLNKEKLHTLNIGLGCGLTLATLADNAKTEHVDIAEINPVIISANEYFKNYNNSVLGNSKVNLYNIDGFAFLSNTKTNYDLIAIDVENPSIVHSSPLYTVEFFKKAAKRLKKGGVFTLWAYRTEQLDYLGIIYHSLKEVFPYVQIKYSGDYNDPYLYSSMDPLDTTKLRLNQQDQQALEYVTQKKFEINSLDKPALLKAWRENFNLPMEQPK